MGAIPPAGSWGRKPVVSGYAITNVHEWFAEAFAAWVYRGWERNICWATTRTSGSSFRQRKGRLLGRLQRSHPAFARWLDEHLALAD